MEVIHHNTGLQGSILLKCQFSPNLQIKHNPSQKISGGFFVGIDKQILKLA